MTQPYALPGHDARCTDHTLEVVAQNAEDAGEITRGSHLGPDDTVWGRTVAEVAAGYLAQGDLPCTCRTVEDEHAAAALRRVRAALSGMADEELVECLRALQVPGVDGLWEAACGPF